MSWDAARITKQARATRCADALPALIAAVAAEHGIAIEPLAADGRTPSGLAVYQSRQTGFASPCVEIMPVEGDLTDEGYNRLSAMRGDVVLSFTTTEADVGPLQDAYLAALVRAFPEVEGPVQSWSVEGVSQSPTLPTDTGGFVAGVSITVLHRIAEDSE